jgi:hypothetical protein
MAPVTQGAFAAAVADPFAADPVGLTTARGAHDPKRFAVYRNNVMAGLTQVLEQRFPVTERLVGEEFFRGMARAFIAAHPARSPLLFDYGEALPDFIAAFDAAAGVPYLADVARLEAAWSRAYHAAEATPLTAAALASVAADKLPDLGLERHPSAFLLRSAWPIGSIWAAHQAEAVEPVGHARPEAVLVVRPDATVTVHILPAQDVPFAEALLEGVPLGEAARKAAAAGGAFDFGSALVGLIGLGAFSSIIQPRPGVPS